MSISPDMFYTLDREGNPVPTSDILEWARWFETEDRIVKKDKIGEALVSTVFLGIRQFGGQAPLLWETMIFGGVNDGEQWRYSTREEALEGHQRAIELVQSNLNIFE